MRCFKLFKIFESFAISSSRYLSMKKLSASSRTNTLSSLRSRFFDLPEKQLRIYPSVETKI